MKKQAFLFLSLMGLFSPIKMAAMDYGDLLLAKQEMGRLPNKKDLPKYFFKKEGYEYEYKNELLDKYGNQKDNDIRSQMFLKYANHLFFQHDLHFCRLKREEYYNYDTTYTPLEKEAVFEFDQKNNFTITSQKYPKTIPANQIEELTFTSQTYNKKILNSCGYNIIAPITARYFGPGKWKFVPDLRVDETAFVFATQEEWSQNGKQPVEITKKTDRHQIFPTLPKKVKDELIEGGFVKVLPLKCDPAAKKERFYFLSNKEGILNVITSQHITN